MSRFRSSWRPLPIALNNFELNASVQLETRCRAFDQNLLHCSVRMIACPCCLLIENQIEPSKGMTLWVPSRITSDYALFSCYLTPPPKQKSVRLETYERLSTILFKLCHEASKAGTQMPKSYVLRSPRITDRSISTRWWSRMIHLQSLPDFFLNPWESKWFQLLLANFDSSIRGLGLTILFIQFRLASILLK